jgi:uncharacterized protein YlxW (UPF0749 family)
MADSDFIPTTWADAVTPITAAQLNRVEAGVELANDRLDAVEAGGSGYTDEQARDAVGSALIAGAGIAVTVDDTGNTITVASTAMNPIAAAIIFGG